MKDIYEHLNHLNLDEEIFEEIEVSEVERARVKARLKKSIQQKKPIRWVKNIAAAAIVIGISTFALGFAFPTAASQILLIGDIFKYLDRDHTGFYDDYKEYSTDIGLFEKNNGIKFMINDAVYDGETVSVTFSVESENDLGDQPIIFDHLDIEGANATGGTSVLKKVSENHYVGLMTASEVDGENLDSVNVKWNVDGIKGIIDEKEQEYKGEWEFAFTLKATDNETKIVGQSIDQKDIQVSIDKLTVTPLSFIIYYEQNAAQSVQNKWEDVLVELEVKDNLGNVYVGKGNGGSGPNQYNVNWSTTYDKLNPAATKLIVTPKVMVFSSEYKTSYETTKFGYKEIELPSKSGKGKEEVVLDEIIINIEK